MTGSSFQQNIIRDIVKKEEMKRIEICPFCGAENTIINVGNEYHCNDCEYDFNDEDAEFEDCRHKVSALVSSVHINEEHPLECDIVIGETHGLNKASNKHIVGVFHDYEAIVWFKNRGNEELYNFDDLTLSEAQKVLYELTYNS